jgi:hypothetical protein
MYGYFSETLKNDIEKNRWYTGQPESISHIYLDKEGKEVEVSFVTSHPLESTMFKNLEYKGKVFIFVRNVYG